MTQNKLNVFILAGEESGDLHGSNIMLSMKKKHPNILFSGIGGKNMERMGFRSLVPMNEIAVMGFWEVLKKLFFFIALEKKIISFIKKNRPDKIILIDYPGLNLRLAKKLKSLNISTPIFYYISPQIWAWKEKRIQLIKKYVDSLIVIFPFEKTWYKNKNIKVEYFGHPLIDIVKKQLSTFKSIRKITSVQKILLLPGSRTQEISRHLPIFQSITKNYYITNPHVHFTISSIEGLSQNLYSGFNKNVTITQKNTLELLQDTDVVIVASGTATLECALAKKPMIVIYKTSHFSWLLSRLFLFRLF